MIKFNQFLAEGRDAPLYHGTSLTNFISMLSTGNIEPRTFHREFPSNTFNQETDPVPQPPVRNFGRYRTIRYSSFADTHISFASGISFTRDIEFATQWAPITIEFNQAKLAQKHKFLPINYYYMGSQASKKPARSESTESEEFLVSNKPIPLKPYVTRIYITKGSDVYSNIHFETKQDFIKFVHYHLGEHVEIVWNK